MKKVFVIIVTYKGKRWYDKCFESLRKSTLPVEIVAVDNTPGNEDAEYIKEHFPEVHLIKTEENLGFGRANNLGMRYALDNRCDYVFLLNQDTWLEQPEAIERLVEIAEKHPEYGILSPMHLSAGKKLVDMNIEYDDHTCSKMLVSDLYCECVKDIYPTDYINAAAWLLPRKTLETIGGFDPIFKHYEEDDNYLHRVLYHGLKVGLCPSAFIIHDHPTNPEGASFSEQRQNQFLLADWTDIRKPFSKSSYMRYYMRKLLVNALGGKWQQVKKYRHQMQYLRKMVKPVIEGRKVNMKKQASWL